MLNIKSNIHLFIYTSITAPISDKLFMIILQTIGIGIVNMYFNWMCVKMVITFDMRGIKNIFTLKTITNTQNFSSMKQTYEIITHTAQSLSFQFASTRAFHEYRFVNVMLEYRAHKNSMSASHI